LPIKRLADLVPTPEPAKAEIFHFVRLGGRVPSEKFFTDCEKQLRKRFYGSFGMLARLGGDYCGQTRFKPLREPGKPLWEFKEHDHRLYCVREFTSGVVRIVLLNGWVKDKTKGQQENNEITTAQNLYREYLAEGKST